jgi:ATP-binding cassette subfamily B protein
MANSLTKSLPSLARIFRRFRPHLAREKPIIVGSVAALLAGTLLKLLEPWPLKFVFDRVIPTRKHPRLLTTFAWFDEIEPRTLLLYCAVALVAIVALRAMAEYFNRVGFAKIGNRVLTRVRNELFRHVQALSLSFHTSARTGDLTVRLVSDVNMLRDVMVTAILPLVAGALVLVGMWAVMFALQWRLALLGLAVVPLLGLWTTLLSHRIREAARKQRKREGAMASTANDSVSCAHVVQAYGLEPILAATFQSRSESSQQQDVKTARLSARLERTVDVLLAIATALVLWYGVRLVIGGEMTPGDLLIFLAYLRRAFNPVEDFAKYSGRLAKAAAAGERVLDLLDRPPEIGDLPGARPAPRLRGHVVFDAVTFRYGPPPVNDQLTPADGASPPVRAPTVLQELTLEFPAGVRAAVVGPSGAGKSTLASLIPRLYDPESGRVLIDGHEVREFTLDSLRRQVALVMQDAVLFAAPIRENIAYGLTGGVDVQSPQIDVRIEAAARLANAHDFISALPGGYATNLGERGVTLSGGERQRIAIARAAVRDAPILILDEPTTGLDEQNKRDVIEALHRVGEGRTTLLITHDLGLAATADMIFYVESGNVVEQGSHDELMRADGRYAALHRLQNRSPAADPLAASPPPPPEVASPLAQPHLISVSPPSGF